MSEKPSARFVLYSTVGNLQGVDEYLGYSELDAQGYWIRYIEIRSDGTAVRYSESHAADSHGVLPEGQWPGDEIALEFGPVMQITQALFETIWCRTTCVNVSMSVD